MSSEIMHLSDADFEQAIQGDTPVLVDFWAAWCAPCRMIAPVLDELAREYAGRVKIAKVNVDEHGGTAQRYGVQSIPTLIVFKGGQAVDKVVGVVPKENLSQLLDQHL
jgi:thioredoxin 1